jgi:hypothetical protein
MPPAWRRGNDHPWPQLANDLYHRRPRLIVVAYARIRQTKIFPDMHPHKQTGGLCFLRPQFRRPARSHLTLCEIENAHPFAIIYGLDERATAREFYIVTMWTYCQQVERHGCLYLSCKEKKQTAQARLPAPFTPTTSAFGLIPHA